MGRILTLRTGNLRVNPTTSAAATAERNVRVQVQAKLVSGDRVTVLTPPASQQDVQGESKATGAAAIVAGDGQVLEIVIGLAAAKELSADLLLKIAEQRQATEI